MNVYELVTARIIEQLEAGAAPWKQTWKGPASQPTNLVSGKPYRGINTFLLSAEGYASQYWLTYGSCKEICV